MELTQEDIAILVQIIDRATFQGSSVVRVAELKTKLLGMLEEGSEV